MRILARLAVTICLLGGHSVVRDAQAGGPPSPAGDPAAAVAAAINQLRGVHLEGMSAAEKDVLGGRLDAAWSTLYGRLRRDTQQGLGRAGAPG
jgi:hypothetical protein